MTPRKGRLVKTGRQNFKFSEVSEEPVVYRERFTVNPLNLRLLNRYKPDEGQLNVHERVYFPLHPDLVGRKDLTNHSLILTCPVNNFYSYV